MPTLAQLETLYCRTVAQAIDEGRDTMQIDTSAARRKGLAVVCAVVLEDAAERLEIMAASARDRPERAALRAGAERVRELKPGCGT